MRLVAVILLMLLASCEKQYIHCYYYPGSDCFKCWVEERDYIEWYDRCVRITESGEVVETCNCQ